MPDSWRRTEVAPRYYLHLRYREGPDGLAVDLEGDEVTQAALPAHVAQTARDLMRGARFHAIEDWRDCSFEVTDEAGRLVLTFPFAGAADGAPGPPASSPARLAH